MSFRKSLFTLGLATVCCAQSAGTAQAQDYCAWNFFPDDPVVNGLYVLDDTGGLPFYRKSIPATDGGACGIAEVFLYQTSGQWHIGPNLGSGFDYLARCESAQFVESPSDCGANWEIASTGTINDDATMFEDACPSWNTCGSVVLTYEELNNPGPCTQGTYVRSATDDNVFEKSDLQPGETGFLYFNELTFRWECDFEAGIGCASDPEEFDTGGGFETIPPLGILSFDSVDGDKRFLAECVAATTTTTTTSSTTTTTIGDCGDPFEHYVLPGVPSEGVTASDALYTLAAGVGLEPCDLCRCDIDNNGLVTATDALGVLSFSIGSAVLLDCPLCF